MRASLILLPAILAMVLVAQTPTPTSPAPAKAAAKSTTTAKSPATKAGTAKAGAAASTTTGAAKAGVAKAGTGKAKAAAKSTTATSMTEEQKTIYALGLSLQRSLAPFDLSAAEIDILKKALLDAAAGKPAVELDTYGPKIQPLATARGERIAARTKTEGQAYLAKAAAEPGAVKTASGLIYKETKAGTGESPKASDNVKVNYRGTLTNGTEFDSSYKRNEPASFPLSGVIKCWTEGVQKMKVGGKATLVCPSDIAYGDGGSPPVIPGGATLVFEIELLGIGS